MRIVFFPHSLRSDWNHGNAHFLRGVIRQLLRLGHEVAVHELKDNWSRWNLEKDHGPAASDAYREAYPELTSSDYTLSDLDLDAMLDGADLVIVHEFNMPELVAAIGEHRRRAGDASYRLLFHDTHHRAVSKPTEMARYDLRYYDGVLAFGNVLRDLYLERGWTEQAWTWHEAADTTVFRPATERPAIEYDLAWIGNWGDEERSEELREFLVEPVRTLGLKAKVWGVRYPDHAKALLADAGIDYGGYLPNHRAPAVFARARTTVHVPRRPYTRALPGIPTIRPFEAMACGIPLVSSPWDDAEGLFEAGRDFLAVGDGAAMTRALDRLMARPDEAMSLAHHARQTILRRHTCLHRALELLDICDTLGLATATPMTPHREGPDVEPALLTTAPETSA